MKSRLQILTSTLMLIAGLLFLGINPANAQNSDSLRIDELEGRVKKIEGLKGLKVSGYIQGQYQYGDPEASLNVGTGNLNKEEGYHRMGIRRGRIKFTYDKSIASAVIQLDVTEKGVSFKDVYMQIKDPKFSASYIKVGVFDRPFGYEITYSSSTRETPERSQIFRTLFPNERDLGVMVRLQPKKGSAWNVLRLDAGLFAGNGIKQDIKNRKDFITRLSVEKKFHEMIKFGAGVSYYNGTVYQGTQNVYTFGDAGFIVDTSLTNIGNFAKREYFGADAQFRVMTVLGETAIAGEYLMGTQPGSPTSTKSPNSANIKDDYKHDTYIRNFTGGYVVIVQEMGIIPLSAVVKYDWYDQNSKVSGDEIGSLNNTSKGDLSFNTLGFGLIWKINKDLRATAYYEILKNELSQNLSGYDVDKKDNLFTLRLQYKF